MKRIKLKRILHRYKYRFTLLVFTFCVFSFVLTVFLRTYSEFVTKPGLLHGVIGQTVYVNDQRADYDYYMGLNYTSSNNGTLPGLTNQNLYNDNNLVYTTVTYDAHDINNSSWVGRVSNTENQNKYVYYKIYPVVNGYIEIPLLDSPWGYRPNDKAFNGWATTYNGANIVFDLDYYERTAKVPVTYTSGKPNDIDITFYTSWVEATTGFVSAQGDTRDFSNWTNPMRNLNDPGMEAINVATASSTGQYFTLVHLDFYDSQTGYYDEYGQIYGDYSGCYNYWDGCDVYDLITEQEYNPNGTYYHVNPNTGTMELVTNNNNISFETTYSFVSPFTSTSNMGGYYSYETVSNGQSRNGYYDSSGNAYSGNCTSGSGCSGYRLITNEVIDPAKKYYYLVTRDTNILVMTVNVNNSLSYNNNSYQTKPFTITSLNNGTKYNIRWNLSHYIRCLYDLAIEHITINSGTGITGSSGPGSSAQTNRYIYGNWNNLKLGKGIARHNSNSTATVVEGGYGSTNPSNNTSFGSTNNLLKYKLIVESGFYNSLSATSGAIGTSTNARYSMYTDAKIVYGNDYDRVNNTDNSKLQVYYIASGAWGGNIRSNALSSIAYHTTVKSGDFGTGTGDYSFGLYVGGLSGGNSFAAKAATIEGGHIFNINGGPTSDTSMKNYNDTYLYMKGGVVDSISGGAGRSLTYGNRILQITGGTVTYNVFGGSNGIEGNTSSDTYRGILHGTPYVYVGGHATIGNANPSGTSAAWGAGTGNVFGIGNGNNSADSIGTCDNSNVVIDGSANIIGSVFGGGNYGGVGISTTSSTTYTKMKIYGGTIAGSVYGAGNRAGSGVSGKTATITIDMTGGIVAGSVYGGSNITGDVYGSSSVNIINGTVTNNVYGGGQGGYVSSSNDGTYIQRSTSVVIGNSSNGPIIGGSVYGGSAYGTVNSLSRSTSLSSYDTTVTVNRGTISGSVYGAGQGRLTNGDNYYAYNVGNVIVNVNGGSMQNIYGGSDEKGIVVGAVDLNVTSGTISGNVYGGGRGGYTNNNLQGTYVGRAVDVTIGDNNNGPTISGNVYGGSAYGTVNGLTQTTTKSSYNTTVTVNKGSVNNVYGAGQGGVVGSTVFKAAVLGNATTTVNGGNIANIYGGSDALGTVIGASNVNVIGGNISQNVYGGGRGGYINTNQQGTFVREAIAVVIGNNNGGPTISGNVYGGSAFGTVNNLSQSTTLSSNNTSVTVNNGTMNNVYGGGQGGTENGTTYTAYVVGNVSVTVNNGTIVNIYGGSDELGLVVGSVDMDILEGDITGNVYGGGRGGYISSTSPGTFVGRNVDLTIGNSSGGPVITGNVYGGSAFGTTGGLTNSNTLGSYNTTIVVNNGTMADLYGAGQGGILNSVTYNSYALGNVTITVNNGTFSNIYGGSDDIGVVLGSVDMDIISGNVTHNVYGGGRGGYNSVSNPGTFIGRSVDLTLGNNSSGPIIVGSVYGGSAFGTVNGLTQTSTLSTYDTTVIVNRGTIGNVFGGGQGGTVNDILYTPYVEGEIHLTINGGTITSVYGGNDLSGIPNGTARGSVIVNLNGGNITDAFGGGNASSVHITDIYLRGATVNKVYGGSDQIGDVSASYVTINSGVASEIYGGNNLGGTTTTTNVVVSGATINSSIYGGGNRAAVGNSIITISGSGNKIPYIFGGSNAANAGNTVLNISGRSGEYVFGGSNSSGTVTSSSVNINSGSYDYVYGSNNAGGKTNSTNVRILGGSVIDVYGGGNVGETGIAVLYIDDATISGDAFGGGKQARVSGGTDVDIIDSTILGNVYGGGDNGIIGTVPDPNVYVDYGALGINTDVYIHSSSIGDCIYAGGNGATAIVYGNTILNIDGTTSVTHHVFGGGNAAETGSEVPEALRSTYHDSSTGVVNIVGATVGGHVYGGANISKIWGITEVNIGRNAVNNNALTPGNIVINGTVFGGGEKDFVGEMNFRYISVTVGITINIDASNHTVFTIGGSIFGSGNASSSGGYSNVNIKNYGTRTNIKNNISIQRADVVVFDNCNVKLEGTIDSTTFHDTTLFTLNRILHIKLKNNSILYLRRGANLVAEFSSLVDIDGDEEAAEVIIDNNNEDISRNVDNRIYMYSSVSETAILNLSNDENNGSAFAPITGMTFFGLYDDRSGTITTAMYDANYENNKANTVVSSNDFYHFFAGSYVVGKHMINHNTHVNGFYTNVENEEDEDEDVITLKAQYIKPTPDAAAHYQWSVGEVVSSYSLTLTASKFSTLGAKELPLISHTGRNTVFSVVGFNYGSLDGDVVLKRENEIPRVASSATAADNEMSLVMKTTNTGWLTVGETTYLTDLNNSYRGTVDYYSENSDLAPTLYFYLYHSKNIGSSDDDMGSVVISLLATTPIDDITNRVERINITIKLTRVLETDNNYEAAITAGKQYGMFSSTSTNITSTSSFSTYYDLFINSDTNIYQSGYHRSLVSTYVFPEKTKITMIDFGSGSNPEYYYYVVSAADVITAQQEYNLYRECSYDLSRFIRMGSSNVNNNFDDAAKNNLYYDSDLDAASEQYVFMVDFGESNIQQDVEHVSLLIELRNGGNQTIVGVLDYQQLNTIFYSLYVDEDAVIEVDANINKTTLYVGETANLRVTTNFMQNIRNGHTVVDTNYFDKKLGLKIYLLDSSNNVVDGYSLMGLAFNLNGISYYPRTDGSYRINVSDRVANVASNFIINTASSNLATGTYTIVIESFGSPDGIYYGVQTSSVDTVTLNVINAIYGLDVSVPDNAIVIDKDTGLNDNNSDVLPLTVRYSSGLSNPKLRISLYRRKYVRDYSTEYEIVDLAEYVTNPLTLAASPFEYELSNSPLSETTKYYNFKPGKKTGTYKLTVSLYDQNSLIGQSYQYIFIK